MKGEEREFLESPVQHGGAQAGVGKDESDKQANTVSLSF